MKPREYLKEANTLLIWQAPQVLVLDMSNTHGKRRSAIEGGPWVADRCTNMDNPNYNPNDWSCLNLGPS